MKDMNGDGVHGVESESLSAAEDTLTLVTTEINRRLQAGRVRDIADGTLFKYHQDLTKWMEKNRKEEIEQKEFNLLDQIDFLPNDRAIELLEEEIRRREKSLKEHKSMLRRLRKNATV